MGPQKITPISYGKINKNVAVVPIFFTARDALEINRLDKIARRSKRVGDAIADLWGSHLVGVYYM